MRAEGERVDEHRATLHAFAHRILADHYAAPVAALAAFRLIYHNEPGPLLALISEAGLQPPLARDPEWEAQEC